MKKKLALCNVILLSICAGLNLGHMLSTAAHSGISQALLDGVFFVPWSAYEIVLQLKLALGALRKAPDVSPKRYWGLFALTLAPECAVNIPIIAVQFTYGLDAYRMGLILNRAVVLALMLLAALFYLLCALRLDSED